MKVIFIVPCFNASKNLEKLVNSVRSQKNSNWSLVLIDDISDDDTFEKMSEILNQEWNTENKIEIIKNKEKYYSQ